MDHTDKNLEIDLYKCTICELAFFYEGKLASHLVQIHKINHYLCEICKETFSTRTKFTNHRSVYHGSRIVFEERKNDVTVFVSNLNQSNLNHGKPHACDKVGSTIIHYINFFIDLLNP